MAHAESSQEWEVRVETCRISLWRGYVTSSFAARLVDGADGGALVDASSSFRWRRTGPPDTEEARLAHHELLSRLGSDGWAPSGEGAEWYAVELARPVLVRPTDAAPPEPEPAEVPAPEGGASQPSPVARVEPPPPVAQEPAPSPPAEESVVEPRSHPHGDRWRVAATVGLLVAVALLVLLAAHG